MDPIDPYKMPAGPELDAAIQRLLFEKAAASSGCPNYSEDPLEASKVIVKLKTRLGEVVITGRTRIKSKPWFARYDKDASTSTEVVAETSSLAICRLALLRVMREQD